VEESAIEDLFERNADTRLLELRHKESGRTAGAVRQVGSMVGTEPAIVSTSKGADSARLRVAIAAVPATGVIPGAVVGVAIDVYNDGNLPAPESTLVVSLPIEAEYRNGTLRIDGREAVAPERLFGEGLPVGRLPGASMSKIVFQLAILPGLNPLYLQPRLTATAVPIVGTPGISIKRATASAPERSAPPVRPFYELDDDEVAAVEAETVLPIVPPVIPLAPPPAPSRADVMPVSRDVAAAVPAALPPALAKARPKPRSIPAPGAGEERMACFRTVTASEVALLEQLFAAERPGVIAHYILISTIACTERDDGPDTTSLASFLRDDGVQLGRAIVLGRLGKKVDYRVNQSSLDGVALPWQPTATRTVNGRNARRRLRRDVRETECSALADLVKPSKRDPHLRLRIALLALAGATLEGAPAATAEECAGALAAYRARVLAWLVPLCVASANADGSALPEPPANVDVAGRRAAAVLRSAFGS